MATIRTSEPGRVVVGDSWVWRRADLAGTYPAGDGWSLSYVLLNAAGKISITAVADGDAFLVNVPAATTAAFVAGSYAWEASVSKGVDRFRVDTGSIDVLPDFQAAASLDTRTHARKVLEAIEAVIERRATKDQQEYAIDGRSLKRTAIADLLKLRDRYRAEVDRERAAERHKGRAAGRMIMTRFTGA